MRLDVWQVRARNVCGASFFFSAALCIGLAVMPIPGVAQLNYIDQQKQDVGAQKKTPPSKKKPPKKIELEPKTIDPAEVLPKVLTERVTADFSDSSLREFAQWLETERKLVVLLDTRSLTAAGISPAEPISDRLENEPVYFVLERLRALGVGWYLRDDVLHLTAEEEMDNLVTVPHDISRLLAQRYVPEQLYEVITTAIDPDSWDEEDASVTFLGDVMFIRHTDWVQYRITALLQALTRPAERTYVFEPIDHLRIQERLDLPTSVEFKETPLSEAISELASKAKIPIRLHLAGLRDVGVRPRQPVTLTIRTREYRTVLDAILLQFHLRWMVRDGLLWVTSPDEAENCMKTAVYDVGDLCQNESETRALIDTLLDQTSQDYWLDRDGDGNIAMARPGTLVVYATEPAHDAVLVLLRSYRRALLAAQPRARAAADPVETVYYRVPEAVAKDLVRALPELVGRSTWHRDGEPKDVGTIRQLASAPSVAPIDEELMDSETIASPPIIPYAVLVVRHRQSVQLAIRDVVDRVLHGDEDWFSASGLPSEERAGGFGGGGFGGGLLRVPSAKRR